MKNDLTNAPQEYQCDPKLGGRFHTEKLRGVLLFKMFKITKTPDKNISFQTVLSIEHGGFETEFKVVFENEIIYRIEAMTKNQIGQFVHGGASDKHYRNETYAYAKSSLKNHMYQYASKYIAQILKSQLKDVLYYG